jgi:ankyrin repeat protein
MERFFAADLPHLPIDILVPEAQISRSRFLAERKMRQLGFEVSGLASEPVEMFAGHEGDAFIKAVQQGNLKAVVGFLHRNIDINYQPQFRGGHKGRTALMHAAENRNEPMVRLLLACGADASLEYCPPSVGLVMAYLFSGNYSVLNAVDFAFDSGDENIFTMLYEASKYSLREGKIGDLLFKALAKMGEGGAFGEFLREWALSKAINEVKNVKELLVTDSQDYTLLMRATEKNHFEFAQILLAQISRLSKDNTLLLYVNQRRIGESSAEGATLPFKTALNIAQDKGYFMFVELFNVMASIDNKTEIVP